VRVLEKAISGAEETTPVKGVREKRVVTDRTLYALTRLAAAYLAERRERFKSSGNESYAADRALETAIITAPEARDPELLKKLDAVAGRILRA